MRRKIAENRRDKTKTRVKIPSRQQVVGGVNPSIAISAFLKINGGERVEEKEKRVR